MQNLGLQFDRHFSPVEIMLVSNLPTLALPVTIIHDTPRYTDIPGLPEDELPKIGQAHGQTVPAHHAL
jgi:hypothetical protein